jgi:hypothetical protein
MKLILIFFAIFIILNPVFSQDTSKVVYEGNIDVIRPIVMELEFRGESVTGSYYYVYLSEKLLLEGYIDSTDYVYLEEYNQNGDLLGFFSGKIEGNKFSGKWISPDRTEKKEFAVNLVKNDKYEKKIKKTNKVKK